MRAFLTYILCFVLFGFVHAQHKTDTLTIFFNINRSTIDTEKAKQLDTLIADKNIKSVSIYGYTDFLGNADYNQKLSEQRSTNVYNYLVWKGFNKENIAVYTGKGIHPNSAEKNRQNPLDKWIQDHRIVQIIYSSTSQSDNLRVQTNLSAQTPMARSESRPALTANYFGPIRNLQGHILYDDMGFETGHGLGMERRSSNLSKEDLVVGNNIVLNNVLFNPGSDLLRPESRPALEELFEVMEEYSTLKIEVHGHICCVTEDPTDLSGRRAREVRNFLTRQGIEPNRIRARGFGATQRLYPLEQNEYEKQMNRRVEIFIVEI